MMKTIFLQSVLAMAGIITKAARAAQTYQREVIARSEDDLLRKVVDSGVEVNTPADSESFRAAMADVPGKLGIVPQEWIEKLKIGSIAGSLKGSPRSSTPKMPTTK